MDYCQSHWVSRLPTTGSVFRRAFCLFACGALLTNFGAGVAKAQFMDSFSINFAKIEAVDGVATFGIDAVLTPDDVLEVEIPGGAPLADVVIKHETVSHAGDGAVVFISENINFATFRESSGDSGFRIEGNSNEKAPAAACEVVGNLVRVTTADGAAALRLLEVRFDALGGEQLRGTPAVLFNQPAPGQPLVLKLPRVEPGDDYSAFVEIRHTESSVRIPITVKHFK